MFRKKNRDQQDAKAPKPASASGPDVTVHSATLAEKPVRRNFPGPRGAQSPLRIAIERGAHADLIAHAKESLNAEICGVLAGRVCEDNEGLFVHVAAAIRGTAANEGSTHVTFTHATWNAIHRTLERDHPDLRIIGWYHSHPGFGVEFSEMDVFIQKNFFSSPTQIALVMDPLDGSVGVCMNTSRGIEYLPRYWVDGREQVGKVPAKYASRPSSDSEMPKPAAPGIEAQALEQRIGQLVLAVDDLRSSMYRWLTFMGMLTAIAILVVAGFAIIQMMKARVEPPKNIGFAEVPVRIGDHTALIGVQIVKWQLPPELDVMEEAIERVKEELRSELEAAANAFLTNQAALLGSNAPSGGISTNKP